METIAITNWNGIISPLYDAACCFVITRGGQRRDVVDVRDLTVFQKADLCSSEGVTVVICGAISTVGSSALQSKGIKVISWIRGGIEDVIAAYKNNSELPDYFFMPGVGKAACLKKNCFQHHHRRRCQL